MVNAPNIFPQMDIPRGDSLAAEGQLLPLELACFVNRAEPSSGLGNLLWCNHGDVRVAVKSSALKVKRWVMP
jgi:hypothetical protein